MYNYKKNFISQGTDQPTSPARLRRGEIIAPPTPISYETRRCRATGSPPNLLAGSTMLLIRH